jgi:MFS family permease
MEQRIRVVAAVARDRRLVRVQLAFLGFNMAEYATWIALLVYAYERAGATGAGVVALIQLVPAGLAAPFAAFAGDRFRRDRVLFGGYLVQAMTLGGVAVALAVAAPVAITCACAAVASMSLTFTRPTQAALLPGITDTPEDLTAANAVSGLAESTGIFAGPFIAGLLLAASGPAAVFAVFAGVTLVGALLVARVDARGAGAIRPPSERMSVAAVVHETLAGFGVLRRERSARLVILVLLAGTVVVGALDVLFVAVAIDLLGEGQGWAGFLNAAFGLGAIVGAAVTIALIGRWPLAPPMAGGVLLLGAPVAVVGFAPAAATAPVLFAATGAGRSIAAVAGTTLLQRITPDAVMGRVFGALEGLSMFALAAGSVSASVLIGAFGIRTALVATGVFVPAVVLLLWVPIRSIDRAAQAPDPAALALLRRLPIFAPLPALAMERIMADLVRLEVPAGAVVIREGDEGDRFYVIASGTIDVSRGGVHLADRVAGDFFGEIALLRDVPRTATVTAKTPLSLLALDRGPFLEAVTGHAASHASADVVVESRLRDEP